MKMFGKVLVTLVCLLITAVMSYWEGVAFTKWWMAK